MKREIFAKIIFALALLCSNAFAYTLTISVSSSGGGTVSPTSKTVSAKTTVSIEATPVTGRVFSSWTYVSGSKTYCQVADPHSAKTTVYVDNGDCTLSATFIIVRNVEVVAGAGGMVAVKEGEWTASTEKLVQNGMSWTIRAMAGAGYVFDKWTSDVETCTFDDAEKATTSVHPNTDCKVTASFAVAAELTVSATTGGSVTPSYSGELVKKGSSVNIEATPSAGYQFYQWVKKSGDCTISSTSSASTKVTVNGTCSIEADFRKERKLTMVLGTNGSSVSPSGTTTVRDNVATSIFAYAKSGYVFGSWSVSGTNCKVSTSTSSSTSAYLQSDCTITANFIPAHTVTIKHVNWDGTGSTYTETQSVGEGKTLSLPRRTGYPYKPNTWKVTSGTCTLSSSTGVLPTLTMKTGDCAVEAQYVHSVAKKVIVGTTYVNYDDYYQLSPSLMAFVLETEDGVWYRAGFPYAGYLKSYYGSDETLSHEFFNSSAYSSSYIYFKGDGQKHYFTYAYVSSYSYSFSIVKVTSTVPLEIEATKGGSVNYQGETQAPYNGFLYISAVADPYYKFVKWNVLGGTCSVYNTTNANTYLRNLTGSCHVRAEFEVDSTQIPEVELVQVDQSEYPEKICAEYKMRSNAPVDASNYSINVDGANYEFQLDSTEINDGKVSAVLVVDGSSSISSSNAARIRSTLAEFIDNLPNNVSLAIVQYGGSTAEGTVLHELSADKTSLKNSLNSYRITGNTNTMAGVKTALDQLDGAPGKRVVLLVTEGATNVSTHNVQSLIDRAQSKDVEVHSIYLQLTSSAGDMTDVKNLSQKTDGTHQSVTSVDGLLKPLLDISNNKFRSITRRVCYAPKDSIQNGDSHEMKLDISVGPGVSSTITWTEPKCVEKDVEDALFMFNADVPEGDPAYELVNRSSTRLAFRVETQDFTGDCSPRNSIQVQVSCEKNGDQENLELDHVLGGTYELKNALSKQEGSAIKGNGILECAAEDVVKAKYVDPVYKTVVTRSAMFSDSVKTRGEFSVAGSSMSLEYAETFRGMDFDFKALAVSSSVNKVDSLDVLLYTSQGDTLWAKAVETGKYTSNFLLRDSVTVVFDKGDMKKDRLDVLMSGEKLLNKIMVYARIVEDGKVSDVQDSILMFYDFPESDIAVYDGEDEGAEIDRATESLRVYVNTLGATDGVDTIEARLYCRNTGDSESLKLVQMADTTDHRSVFGMKSSIPKNELKAVKNDGNLSCAAVDTVVAEYRAPYNRNAVVAEYAFADSAAIVPVDSAEIYDKDLDGRADFVRVHFAKDVDADLLRVDTVFWNASGREGRGVRKLKAAAEDGWFESKLDDDFDYGVTDTKVAVKHYLNISKKTFNYSQKISLKDRVGAVPVYVEKRPGLLSNDDFLNGEVELPPDSLVVTLSEPLEVSGSASGKGRDTWQKLFQFAEKCDGKMRTIALKTAPKVDKSGLVWTLVLPREIDVRVGNCLVTNPAASYQDAAGNAPAVGGVTVEGDDGETHMYAIYPYPAIARDSVSGVRTETKMGYRASVSIFDNLGHVVAQQKYSFGRNGELDDPDLENAENATHFGTITWNQCTEDGRQVSSGVYIWKILFVFDDGHREWRYVKSGVKR